MFLRPTTYIVWFTLLQQIWLHFYCFFYFTFMPLYERWTIIIFTVIVTFFPYKTIKMQISVKLDNKLKQNIVCITSL